MSSRASVPMLTVAGVLDETSFRTSQLVWPLLALAIGSGPWTVGLATGAFGIPVMLAPWWSTRLRQRVTSSHRIALLSVAEVAVLAVVPALLVVGALSLTALVVVGLARGVLTALTVPGRSALMADVGDALPGSSATRALAWDEGQTRVALVVGPALGGALWAWGQVPATTASVVLCLLAAGASGAARAQGRSLAGTEHPPTIRASLRGRAEVQATWLMRGVSALAWFGLGIGLPLLSEEQGHGATLAAWALAAYGVGGLVAALGVGPVIDRLPTMHTQQAGWCGMGVGVVVVGLVDQPVVVVAACTVAGGCTQVANMAGNGALARSAAGAERRALLSGQRTLVTVLSTVGLMASGPAFALGGTAPVIAASGAFVALVGLTAVRLAGRC